MMPGQQDGREKDACGRPDGRDAFRLKQERQTEPRRCEIDERNACKPKNVPA